MCNCYVSQLSEEQRFSLRSGSHADSCPVYHESLDPVDRLYDLEAKAHLGGGGECPSCKGYAWRPPV